MSSVVRMEPLDRPFGRYKRVGLRHWCREYDVIPALIPFSYRTFGPIETIHDLQEMVESAAPTNATFSVSQIDSNVGRASKGDRDQYRTLLRIVGLWQFGDGSHFEDGGRVTRWVNPEYVHAMAFEPSITDTRYRIEELRRAASIGLFTLPDIAPRFGTKDNHVQKFCKYHEIPWTEWRNWGRRRLSRSVKTIYEWTDHSYNDLAAALGIPRMTLWDWIHEFYAADFEPPADPSSNHWFKPSNYGDRA